MKVKFETGDMITCPCGTTGFTLDASTGSVDLLPARQRVGDVEFVKETLSGTISRDNEDLSGAKFIADGSFTGSLSLRGIFGTRPKDAPECVR